MIPNATKLFLIAKVIFEGLLFKFLNYLLPKPECNSHTEMLYWSLSYKYHNHGQPI